MRKYRNKKVVFDGVTFDSIKEKNRYVELKLLERAGEISNLQRQVKFTLIPAQYEMVADEKGKAKRKVAEREVSYIADFSYYENGFLVVEDVKGVKTKDYIIKRKMMRYLKGIKISEV